MKHFYNISASIILKYMLLWGGILIQYNAVSQQTTLVEKGSKHVRFNKIARPELSFYISPELAYRNLKGNNDANLIQYRDTVETPKFGYTVGINTLFYIKKNMAFELGILFTNKGQKTKKVALGNSLNQTELPIFSKVTNHFFYFGVPIKVNYYLINNNFKLFITGGAIINILVDQKTTTVLEYSEKQAEQSSAHFDDNYNKLNTSLFFGIGIQKKLSDNYFFVLTPTYTHSIQSVTSDPIKSYFYSGGLNFALNKKF